MDEVDAALNAGFHQLWSNHFEGVCYRFFYVKVPPVDKRLHAVLFVLMLHLSEASLDRVLLWACCAVENRRDSMLIHLLSTKAILVNRQLVHKEIEGLPAHADA